jgi:heterodisulfide reductase subunit A-like polyferredoxin
MQRCLHGGRHQLKKRGTSSVDIATVITPLPTCLTPLAAELATVYPQVITTLSLSAWLRLRATAGRISLNGNLPKRVVFIQCVACATRSARRGARVCCMAVATSALGFDRLPGAEITVFYIDIRAFGKGFE